MYSVEKACASISTRLHKYFKILYFLENDIKPKSKILDLGCGLGEALFALDEFLGNNKISGCQLIGTEINFKKLSSATKYRKQQRVTNLHLIVSDIRHLPFRNGIANVIICSQVLEHVSEKLKVLKELNRILIKKEGILFLSTSNKIFPIETHLKLPLVHWLPKSIVLRFLSKTRKRIYEGVYHMPSMFVKRLLYECGFKPTYISHCFFSKKFLNSTFGLRSLSPIQYKLFPYFSFFSKIPKLLFLVFPYTAFKCQKIDGV